MFKEDRFERMICEFGQFTGVTATGLLLLRTVDPESKTSAPTAFGCKQLFHEPVMGGGVWTAMAVPLVVKLGPWHVFFISLAMMVLWWALWYVFLRKDAAKTK
jgi:ESS family glutamate:Na+ symporter